MLLLTTLAHEQTTDLGFLRGKLPDRVHRTEPALGTATEYFPLGDADRYPNLPDGARRDPGHRFEWTRAEFAGWCAPVAAGHGYRVRHDGVGGPAAALGRPTRPAEFHR